MKTASYPLLGSILYKLPPYLFSSLGFGAMAAPPCCPSPLFLITSNKLNDWRPTKSIRNIPGCCWQFFWKLVLSKMIGCCFMRMKKDPLTGSALARLTSMQVMVDAFYREFCVFKHKFFMRFLFFLLLNREVWQFCSCSATETLMWLYTLWYLKSIKVTSKYCRDLYVSKVACWG